MNQPSQPVTVPPPWSAVLRGLREARGVTQDGWAALLGFGRATVQRWERGEVAPSADAVEALVMLCREQGLLRTFEHGRLRGLSITAELLRELLAETRLAVAPVGSMPPSVVSLPVRPPAPASDLPASLTRFIGRETEIARLQQLLGTTRLVTLTGPGGSGKTRLAIEAARAGAGRFPDGAIFVSLAPLTDPALVAGTIARALVLRDAPDQPLEERLRDYLRSKRLLLVLDNFEHLLEAAPLVAELLAHAPSLTVLATSRSVLHLRGETRFPVPPLSLPGADHVTPAALLARSAAVSLFVERAQEVAQGFTLTDENAVAVAAICTRLDGLPLAIELAAVRIRLLSPDAIGNRLGERLNLLTGGARDLPVRQQTLRRAIGWSYDLLTKEEQALFRQLSVFVGGCTLAAAEAVCSADGGYEIDMLDALGSLVDKSLLLHDAAPGGGARFTMLETVREYALEQLAAEGEVDSQQRRHASYYLTLAEQAEPDLQWANATEMAQGLEREHGNLRAAFRWALAGGESEIALRLAGALFLSWMAEGYVSEGCRWLEKALAHPGPAPDKVRAKALYALGRIARFQDDSQRAAWAFGESLRLARQIGDSNGIARCLFELGGALLNRGDIARATALFEESLALCRAIDDSSGMAWSLQGLGRVALWERELERAAGLFQECLALQRSVGDRIGIAIALDALGTVCQAQRDYAQAVRYFEQSLALRRATGARSGLGEALLRLAVLLSGGGDVERAAALLGECLTLSRELHMPVLVAHCLLTFGGMAGSLGQRERAARLFGAGAALLEARRASLPLGYRGGYARVVADVRAALGEETFAAAYAEGHALSLDAAVALALEQVERGESQPTDVPSRPDSLSPRETEVLRLLAAGHTNQEIAAALVLSARTVEHHQARIYAKIHARGRTDAVAYAVRHGLIQSTTR